MDWSKAKTILIIAFIITNLLLAYVLISSQKQVETTTSSSFVQEVIGLLAKKDISISGEIPREIPSLNTLTVEFEKIDPIEMNRRFFDGKGRVDFLDPDTIEIRNNEENLLITNKKTLIYKDEGKSMRFTDLNEDKAKEIGLEFLESKGFPISDLELSYIKYEDDTYLLEFTRTYKERYLEKANVIIEIDNRGIKTMERTWLNPIEEGEKLIYINTAPKAILSLLNIEEAHGKTIREISLAYYFEAKDFSNRLKDAKGGKTVPAWRVLFEDGYKLIIDNY